MTSPIIPTDPAPPSQVQQPKATDPTTAGAIATSGTPGAAGYSASTTIKTLDELKKKAPEVYNATIRSIAQSICRRMEHNQAALKKLWQEMRR